MRFFFLFFLLTIPVSTRAESCGWNADRSFWSCGAGYGGGSTGGSSSSINQAVESNPANLPVDPTSFGLEGAFANRSSPEGKSKFSVSTIKGFEGIGFGIGSWTEGSFSAPDLPNHFLASAAWQEYLDYQRNPPSVLGIRLGSSIKVPKKLLPKGIRVAFGGSLGLGRVSGDVSPQFGVIASVFGLGLGYSHSFERISRTLPPINVSTIAAGLNFGAIYLGYSRIKTHSIVNDTYANVVGIRYTSLRWTFFTNAKLQKDHRGKPDTWIYAGALRKLGTRFGVGYEYGVYRYSHSALLQIYL